MRTSVRRGSDICRVSPALMRRGSLEHIYSGIDACVSAQNLCSRRRIGI